MGIINYTSIINSFVSTEGYNGIMTNYVYYSILVVYLDGTKEIVEGRLDKVKPLLAFLKTPQDEIQRTNLELDQLKMAMQKLSGELAPLKGECHNISNTVNSIKDSYTRDLDYIIRSLFPIPVIDGLNEVDAIEAIRLSGLTPVLVNTYPPSTPQNGIVRGYKRNPENFREVFLEIIHVLPDIKGLPLTDAQKILDEEGFSYTIEEKAVESQSSGIVISCERPNDTSMNVVLTTSICIPDLRAMDYSMAINEIEKIGFRHRDNWESSNVYSENIVRSWRCVKSGEIELYISKGPGPSNNTPQVKNQEQEKEQFKSQNHDQSGFHYYCSQCHTDVDDYYLICPNCGAPDSIMFK